MTVWVRYNEQLDGSLFVVAKSASHSAVSAGAEIVSLRFEVLMGVSDDDGFKVSSSISVIAQQIIRIGIGCRHVVQGGDGDVSSCGDAISERDSINSRIRSMDPRDKTVGW